MRNNMSVPGRPFAALRVTCRSASSPLASSKSGDGATAPLWTPVSMWYTRTPVPIFFSQLQSPMDFKLQAPFQPMGDQPEAIRGLVEGIRAGKENQVLLGATGTGKTFTIASVIQELQKPALIMAHNKTLAAQLYAEFKEFFPQNAVSYFVSY